ncbi:hypothetical protein [Streptomyces sp. 8N706]|uniref:hypothetical protein n=1 Tax=Streptomyces sp. 8N706 TaxID=3457416 RepID=UPI003FCF9C1C
MVLRCRVLGHRFRFYGEGETMRWRCVRGCGTGGAKRYSCEEDARRYARAFDREDLEDLGRRAPLVGLFPLRLLRALRRRGRRSAAERRT